MRNHVNNQEALPVMNTSTLQLGAILHTRNILESVLSELESSQVPTESIHAVLKQDRNVCSLDIRKGGTVRHVVLFSNESIAEQVDTALDFDPSMLTFIMENHDQDLSRVRELLKDGLNVNILFATTHHSLMPSTLSGFSALLTVKHGERQCPVITPAPFSRASVHRM